MRLSKGFKPLFNRRESAHHLPMTARLYRRTQAGKTAWQRQDLGVPIDCRRVLGVIEDDMHPDSVRVRLARYSEAEIMDLLDDLVERGLLEALEAAAHHDLDFTNSFNLADLKKAAG